MPDRDELYRLRCLRDRVAALLRRALAGEVLTVRSLEDAISGPPSDELAVASDTAPRDLGPPGCHLEDTDAERERATASSTDWDSVLGQLAEFVRDIDDETSAEFIRDEEPSSSGTGPRRRRGAHPGRRRAAHPGQPNSVPLRYRGLSSDEVADLERSLREPTDPAVLWFTIRGYRCSFDLRADSSRFIVLRQPGVLLAQGLLSNDQCLLDEDTGQLPAGVADDLIRIWTVMQRRLRDRRRRRGDAEDAEYSTD